MDEQDFKNLISIYQSKYFDQINQNVASEARELKYRQTIESLNGKISDLEKKLDKSKKPIKNEEDFT